MSSFFFPLPRSILRHIIVFVSLICLIATVKGHPHHHPPQDIPSNRLCPSHSHTCVLVPCHLVSCTKFPQATCKNYQCGDVCQAEFWLNGGEVTHRCENDLTGTGSAHNLLNAVFGNDPNARFNLEASLNLQPNLNPNPAANIDLNSLNLNIPGLNNLIPDPFPSSNPNPNLNPSPNLNSGSVPLGPISGPGTGGSQTPSPRAEPSYGVTGTGAPPNVPPSPPPPSPTNPNGSPPPPPQGGYVPPAGPSPPPPQGSVVHPGGPPPPPPQGGYVPPGGPPPPPQGGVVPPGGVGGSGGVPPPPNAPAPTMPKPPQNSGCPGGVPMVRCMKRPCEVSRCPAMPYASCRDDYCGGCNAKFYQGHTEVTSQCHQRLVSPAPAPAPQLLQSAQMDIINSLLPGVLGPAPAPAPQPPRPQPRPTHINPYQPHPNPASNANPLDALVSLLQQPSPPQNLRPIAPQPPRPSPAVAANNLGLGQLDALAALLQRPNANAMAAHAGMGRGLPPNLGGRNLGALASLLHGQNLGGHQHRRMFLPHRPQRPPTNKLLGKCPMFSEIKQCPRSPCTVISCPAIPHAECQDYNCGKCSAKFFFRGQEVTARCGHGRGQANMGMRRGMRRGRGRMSNMMSYMMMGDMVM